MYDHSGMNTPGNAVNPSLRPSLGDATSSIVNAPAPADGSTSKKRTRSHTTTAPRKRRKQGVQGSIPPTNQIGVPGVGPSFAIDATRLPPVSHPAIEPLGLTSNVRGYKSLIRQDRSVKQPAMRTQNCSDVWYFMRMLQTPDKPTSLPEGDTTFKEKPDAPWVGCRLCTLENWHTWKVTNGQTGAIRTHLKTKHAKEWRELVLKLKLKGWEELAKESCQGAGSESSCTMEARRVDREPFTITGFHERLLRWMIVDDQAMNAVESKELREIFLYLCPNLDDEDIPHRTKIRELIGELFKVEHARLAKDAQNALGCISFTCDLWTDKVRRGFFAITLHYIVRHERRLQMRSRLGAFRYVYGSHTGAVLAEHFLRVLKELGIVHKVGMITQDNAGNCDTMMQELEDVLRDLGIRFDSDGNRIRCFPHVVNISVQRGLKELTMIDSDVYTDNDSFASGGTVSADDLAPTTEALASDPEYAEALKSDAVASARSLVAACRASGQRRDDFAAMTAEGNGENVFGGETTLPSNNLLRDVDTRWSSTFMMLDRLLELNPAIDLFLDQDKQGDIEYHRLQPIDIAVIRDVREFLYVPHSAQELLAAERTPTLSLVLPLYENMLTLLRLVARKLVKIGHGVLATVRKLEEYMKKSRKTRIYALAMILNPTIKFEWIERNWTQDECDAARQWMREAMLEYKRAARRSGNPSTTSTATTPNPTRSSTPAGASTTRAARTQASGFCRMQALLRSYSSEGSCDSAQADSAAAPQTAEDLAEAARLAEEQDQRTVDAAIAAYINAGVMTDEAQVENLDLVAYWESMEHIHPLIFPIAMDVLPAQASSVACERVFSSSKETDTLRRSNLSAALLEVLQILKFMFRQDRLDFTGDLLSSEEYLLASELSPGEVDTMLAEGKLDELFELMKAADGPSRGL